MGGIRSPLLCRRDLTITFPPMHPSLRLRAALLLCSLLPAAALSAADLEIARVLPGWRSAESFHRLSEYFGAKSNDGDPRILRSQPAEKAGYYWLVRLKNPHASLPGARFKLEVIGPTSPEPKTFLFAADLPSGSSVFQIGLTGSDWPGARARPDAWHLSLLAPDGKTLLARESFLWEMPVRK